jgi:hypothetical protein
MTEHFFDHNRLDVYRLSIEYVAAAYASSRSLEGLHRHARDQWLRRMAIKFDGVSETLSEYNQSGEHEHEHEHEHDEEPEPSDADEALDRRI